MLADRIRRLFVVSDTSLAERMRMRRWELVQRHLPQISEMDVLELGGTVLWWSDG